MKSANVMKGLFFAGCVLATVQTVQATESFIRIDSIVGKVEVQRAGRQNWRMVKINTRLHDNDLVRVLDKSLARLQWPDGSCMFVHANSQLLINLSAANAKLVQTKHVTVFFGAVFFLVKKILPRPMHDAHDTKICTPTSVVSIRGTSFETAVDRRSGKTDIRVINGTVLARNILKNTSLFLGAGYQTAIAVNTDPILPRPLLQTDIDNLKKWVPGSLIKEEMEKQVKKARRDHFIITGKYEDKILALPFANSSSYRGPWDIGKKISFSMCHGMKKQNRGMNIVFKDTVVEDPLVLGAKTNSRFVVTGAVTEFDISQHARISAQADEYKEFNIARIRLRLSIIDVAQKKMLFEDEIKGEVSAKNSVENTWRAIGKLTFDPADKKFAGSIMGKSLQQVLDQSCEKLERYVTSF